MNRSSMLEPVFHEILGVIYPLLEDCTARESAIDQLRAVVATVRSLRGATVEPFGSFLSNLFTRWGDLDISVELSNGSYILSPGKKHKLNLLEDIHRALRTTSVRRLQLISNAKVPVLKFTSDQNISCDISVNNLSGHMKSKFLLWISDIDPRFRDMVLLVKEWAKAHWVNDPKAGTFNSYSLCLLVIFHFQTCKPAIFPPLKEIYPTNMGEELQGKLEEINQIYLESQENGEFIITVKLRINARHSSLLRDLRWLLTPRSPDYAAADMICDYTCFREFASQSLPSEAVVYVVLPCLP